MNKKDVKILDYICDYIATTRVSPTIREISSAFNYRSPTTVHMAVVRLEREGLLYRLKGARNIRLNNDLFNLSHIPTEKLREEIRRREAADA